MRVVRSEKERVSKAAVKIQRITRGHMVRQQAMRMRKEKVGPITTRHTVLIFESVR